MDIEQVRSDKATLDSSFTQLRALTGQLQDGESKLHGLRQEIEKIKATLKEGESLGEELKRLDLDNTREEGTLQGDRRTGLEAERRLQEIEKIRQAVQSDEALIATKESEAQEHKIAAQLHHKRADAKREEIEGLNANLTLLRASKAYREHRAKLEQMDSYRIHQQEITKKIDAARAELDSINAPSVKDALSLNETDHRLKVLQATIRASSVNVKFDTPSIQISAEPLTELSSEGEYLVAHPTVFRLGELGTMRISGTGVSPEDLEESEKLQNTVETLLTKYHVQSPSDLLSLAQLREGKEREAVQLEQERSTIPLVDQLELERLVSIVKDKEAMLEKAPEINALSDSDLSARLERDESHLNYLSQEKDEAVREEAEQSRLQLNAVQEGQNLRQRISAAKGQSQQLEEENRKALYTFGNLEELNRSINKRAETLAKLQSELNNKRALYKQQVEEPKQKKESLESEERQYNEGLKKAYAGKGILEGQIKALTTDDLDLKFSNLEEKHAKLVKQFNQVKLKSEALKLLAETIKDLEDGQSASLSEPIERQVNIWLTKLTNSEHEGVHIDEHSLYPTGVYGGSGPLDLHQLSYGTTEQIGVLTRMAVGVLSSHNERNLLVLDDRLVNSDSVRLERMREILDEVSGKCQVIMTSCHPSFYDGIKGKRIPLT
jgi:hypothetical protein